MSVQLSDLDLAGTADDADLALIRKADTTDYKVTVQTLRAINISGLAVLPAPAQDVDLMMISQGGTNCQIPFSQVSFIVGTRMWFFDGTPPNSAWEIVPNTGDRLLACANGSGTYATGGTMVGTWQQANHTLTIDQIPSHFHPITRMQGNNVKSGTGAKVWFESGPSTIKNTEAVGGGNFHNHGNTWRPSANVGIICIKMA
jgi:hypothetical protein